MSERARPQAGSDAAERVAAAAAGRTLRAIAAAYGIGDAFGVVSIHNQPIVDALAEATSGVGYVPVRHEATAVSAADAHGRVNQSLGLAVTSTGTGAGNAAGALVEALTAGSAVLHVTGNIESTFLGQGRGVIHETKAQHQMLDAVSKAAYTVTAPSEVAPTLWRAAAEAVATPAGPVSVEIPIDLQYASSTDEIPIQPPGPSPEIGGDLELAVELLVDAERPVLWAGGGAIGARTEVEALCRRLGIPLLTSNAGRGVIDERDPLVIGNFAARPGGQRLLEQADLLLSIGTHFRSNETRHYRLALPERHIQIDVDRSAIGRAYPVTVGLVGDAGVIVAALDNQLVEVERQSWCAAAAETRAEVRRSLEADIGPYAQLCRSLRSVLPEQSPLVRDVTIPASAWGNRLLDVPHPSVNVNARGGGIGQGLGMGIGAALARPDVPTLVLVGDGGLSVHLGELATLAQERPWLLLVVFDDGGYGVLRNLQDAHFGHRSGVDLTNPDFAQLAGAFGLGYERLDTPSASEGVLRRAVAQGGPVLVHVDCNAFGPMPVPFVPPVSID